MFCAHIVLVADLVVLVVFGLLAGGSESLSLSLPSLVFLLLLLDFVVLGLASLAFDAGFSSACVLADIRVELLVALALTGLVEASTALRLGGICERVLSPKKFRDVGVDTDGIH
ncbi:hypothetical protein F5879DRAFT_942985 [Lentinula edodes]|nr:hypothetical protein F5879DRAFT_942985 [Lentinula edodes]